MFGRKHTCRWVEKRLWDYCAERLPQADRELTRAHLAECSSCRLQMQQYSTAAGLFAVSQEPLHQASSADWNAVWRAYQAGPRLMPSQHTATARRYATALGALGAVFFIGGQLLRLQEPHGNIHTVLMTSEQTSSRNSERTSERTSGRGHVIKSDPVTSTAVMRWKEGARPHVEKKRLLTGGVRKGGGGSLAAPITDDLKTLNADPVRIIADWRLRNDSLFAQSFARQLTAVEQRIKGGDDFVYVPLPQFASAGSNPQQQNRLMVTALHAYRQEKEIVDTRLNRKISIGVKSLSLEDLCQQLKQKTGVDVLAGKSVADEKITLLCDDQPLREIMRQINRLFGFHWIRNGEEGSYRYQLWQNMREQLAEEEMRNKDRDEALIDIDAKMAEYHPDKREEGWGALQLYRQLSPADFVALRKGDDIAYAGWEKPGARMLPPEVNQQLVAANANIGGINRITWPDYNADASLHLNFSELGQVTLEANIGVFKLNQGGYGGTVTLATGRSPSVASPKNAEANKILQNGRLFRQLVSLHPMPSCPQWAALRATGNGSKEKNEGDKKEKNEGDKSGHDKGHDQESENKSVSEDKSVPDWPTDGKSQSSERFNSGIVGTKHLVTADVWEEVHKQTGMPIIADSYTRLHRMADGTTNQLPLYAALSKVADAMGSHWKKDGAFIECRTTSFFWDRLKEVPRRLLERWHKNSEAHGGLPLNDFLEMAELSDQQLDSQTMGDALIHCWKLSEWDALSKPTGYYSARSFARYLSQAQPTLRKQFLEPNGVAIGSLSVEERSEFVRAAQMLGRNSYVDFENMAACRFRMEYLPSHVYVWQPGTDYKYQVETTLYDRTREQALAKARKVDPTATAAQIVLSPGSFVVIQISPQGESTLIAGVKTHLLFNPYKNAH